MKLENSVAIVTGGASGFGAHIVRALLIYGARVAVIDINEKEGKKMEEEIDPELFMFIQADVTLK